MKIPFTAIVFGLLIVTREVQHINGSLLVYLLVEKPMTNALRPLVRVSRNRRQLA